MSKEIKTKRRDFLFTVTYAIGAVGVGTAIWPIVDQMNPDSSVKALSTTEVDISSVEPGKTITVLWRGKPIFIRRRTKKEIEEAANVDLKDLIQNINFDSLEAYLNSCEFEMGNISIPKFESELSISLKGISFSECIK